MFLYSNNIQINKYESKNRIDETPKITLTLFCRTKMGKGSYIFKNLKVYYYV